MELTEAAASSLGALRRLFFSVCRNCCAAVPFQQQQECSKYTASCLSDESRDAIVKPVSDFVAFALQCSCGLAITSRDAECAQPFALFCSSAASTKGLQNV
jgi:hypothetical protein